MKKIRQTIKGNNNVQILNNNAPIIHTGEVKLTTEVVHNPDNHITDAQALQVREKITEVVTALASDGTDRKMLFGKEYKSFYNKFGITKYNLLPKDKFEEAMKWLQKKIASSKKVLKEHNPTEWRKALYKSINARANHFEMNRDSLLAYAVQVLDLETPLLSIKDLNDEQLQKLYDKLFRKR